MTGLKIPDFPMDPLQRRAAEALEGPALIEGAHGTGKTHTSVFRIGVLLERGVSPGRIACITGTAHGRDDLINRLAGYGRTESVRSQIFVGPMAALALLLLHAHRVRVGELARPFTLRDPRQSEAEFRATAGGAFRNHAREAPGQDDPKVKSGQLDAPWRWYRSNRSRHADAPLPAGEPWWWTVAQAYDDEKRLEGVVDVDDLVPLALRAMKGSEHLRSEWQRMYDHYIVDDVQNFTAAETDLLVELTRGSSLVTATASPNVAVRFGADSGSWPRLALEMNRSGSGIHRLRVQHRSREGLSLGARAFASDPSMDGLREDPQYSVYPPEQSPAILMEFDGRPRDMHRRVVTMLRELREEEDCGWDDMACIYRDPATFRAFRTMLISQGIPYTVLGDQPRRDPDVESVIAMLTLVQNPHDSRAFRRAASADPSPSRQLDPNLASAIRATARRDQIDLIQAAEARLPSLRYGTRNYRDLRYVTESCRELDRVAGLAESGVLQLVQAAVRLLYRHQRRRLTGDLPWPMKRLEALAPPAEATGEGSAAADLAAFLYELNPGLNGDSLDREPHAPRQPGHGVIFSTIEAFAYATRSGSRQHDAQPSRFLARLQEDFLGRVRRAAEEPR